MTGSLLSDRVRNRPVPLWPVLAAVVAVLISCQIHSAEAQLQSELPASDDPVLESRYQRLARELRCPKCDNQSVLDSHSLIAQDIRRELWRLLNNEYSDAAIRNHMRESYGDFILYRPRFAGIAIILWLLPLLCIAAGVSLFFPRRKGAADKNSTERKHPSAADSVPPSSGRSSLRLQVLVLILIVISGLGLYLWQGSWGEQRLARRLGEISDPLARIALLEPYIKNNPEADLFREELALAYSAARHFSAAAQQFQLLSDRGGSQSEIYSRLAAVSLFLAARTSTPTVR